MWCNHSHETLLMAVREDVDRFETIACSVAARAGL